MNPFFRHDRPASSSGEALLRNLGAYCLDHPPIVRIHHCGDTAGESFLEMEFRDDQLRAQNLPLRAALPTD